MVNECGEEVIGNYEKWFTNMEIQAIDISHKISILLAYLESKFGPFNDFGGSNL